MIKDIKEDKFFKNSEELAKAIMPYIPQIKEQIEKSKSKTTEISYTDIRKKLGPKFEKVQSRELYDLIKFVLFHEAIVVEERQNILIMRNATVDDRLPPHLEEYLVIEEIEMTNEYECKIVKGKDGHTRAECGIDQEDSYMIEPDFRNFPEGSLILARQFGPNETDEESDKNVRVIVIEKRDIVDRLKDFLNSTREEMVAEYIVAKDFDITYRFEKESHGWLRAEATYKQGGKVSIVDILIHKDVVPSMKTIINQNFIS